MYFQSVIEQVLITLKNQPMPWVILLEGSLGAGKTTFVQEFLQKLGIDPAEVKSPTFLKLLEYHLPNYGKVVHMDCYRMDEKEELHRLQLDCVCEVAIWFVEWPELFVSYVKDNPILKHYLGLTKFMRLKIDIASSGQRNLHIETGTF